MTTPTTTPPPMRTLDDVVSREAQSELSAMGYALTVAADLEQLKAQLVRLSGALAEIRRRGCGRARASVSFQTCIQRGLDRADMCAGCVAASALEAA